MLNIDQTTRKLLISRESIYHDLLLSKAMKTNDPTLTRSALSNVAIIINSKYFKLLVPNQEQKFNSLVRSQKVDEMRFVAHFT